MLGYNMSLGQLCIHSARNTKPMLHVWPVRDFEGYVSFNDVHNAARGHGHSLQGQALPHQGVVSRFEVMISGFTRDSNRMSMSSVVNYGSTFYARL
ncbi:unnamed protein product [Arabis nemorensis]|uniref:Uncharacterized protein n=1 Tax=Arabis nemorensis TaxID=586526 RepID=A0A565BNW7_9BRAS|nr:unnamed protein product [Arabis nemorensis]